jgi:hypothetical protein
MMAFYTLSLYENRVESVATKKPSTFEGFYFTNDFLIGFCSGDRVFPGGFCDDWAKRK